MKNKAARKDPPQVENGTMENHLPRVQERQLRAMAIAAIVAGFLAGFLVLYFQPFNDVFVQHIRSEKATFINWYPVTFKRLNILSGISVLTFSFAYLIYMVYQKEAVDTFLDRHYRRTLTVLASCMGILTFVVCFNRFFDLDEIEHIHSAWYLKQGYVPYRDFFEHHNPLFWFLLLPVLYLGGDSVTTILLARLFMGCVMLGIVYGTYLIASTVSKSKETGLLAALLTLSTTLFVEKCIEIRPDSPQVLFGMISLYCLIRFIASRDDKFIFATGLSAAISFLFLQKAIFLLIAYGALFAYGFFRREIGVKSALRFIGGFLIPLVVFWAYLQMTGSWHDYFLTNWELNWHYLGAQGIAARPFKPMAYSLIPNVPFWVVSVASIVYILLKQNVCREMKIIIFVGLVQMGSLALFATTFKHYYLFPIVLFSVSGAYFLTNVFAAGKVPSTHRVALAAMVILWALPFLLIDDLNSNRLQLGKMRYVLRVTKETDIVYDGANNFNLFRHDLHYFWFQVGQLKKYNNLTGDRFGDYDVCSLIKTKRPRIVNEMHLDFNACGLDALYDRTQYPGVYSRKEEPSKTGL